METAGSSETLFPVCQAVRRCVSEEIFLGNHRLLNHIFDKYRGRHVQKSEMRCRYKMEPSIATDFPIYRSKLLYP